MLTTINGLPAHLLLVHVVVVLVPLTALTVVLAEVWPAFRKRAGIVVPLVALVAVGSVPLTTEAGDWLIRRVPQTSLVSRHAHLADGLLPWVIGLAAVAVLGWALRYWQRRRDADRGGVGWRVVLPVVMVVAAVVVGIGAVVQVYRIGDSGAQAAWHGRVSQTPAPGSEDDD